MSKESLDRYHAVLRAQVTAQNEVARRAFSMLSLGVAALAGGAVAVSLVPEGLMTLMTLSMGGLGLLGFIVLFVAAWVAALPPAPLSRRMLLTRNPHSLRTMISAGAERMKASTGALILGFSGLLLELIGITTAVVSAISESGRSTLGG